MEQAEGIWESLKQKMLFDESCHIKKFLIKIEFFFLSLVRSLPQFVN